MCSSADDGHGYSRLWSIPELWVWPADGMAMYLQGAMSDRCGLSFPAVVPCLRPPNACVVKSGERNVIQAYECTAVEIGEVNHCKVRKY